LFSFFKRQKARVGETSRTLETARYWFDLETL